VKPEQLVAAPEITPLFKNAEGGLNAVLGAMRFAAQDETIAAFLKQYDKIPVGDRRRIPWEAVGLAAKLNLQQLTVAILFAMEAASVKTVKVLALSAHPKVMRKTIEYAGMLTGVKDRTMLHQGLGFLPTAKGPTFIGKAVFGGGGGREGTEPGQPTVFGEDDDLDELFPPANAMQERLAPIRQRLLPAGNRG
jgi:hypothetical protein